MGYSRTRPVIDQMEEPAWLLLPTLPLRGHMEIVDETGVFEGASGELRVNGQMDWLIGQATFEAHGVITR